MRAKRDVLQEVEERPATMYEGALRCTLSLGVLGKTLLGRRAAGIPEWQVRSAYCADLEWYRSTHPSSEGVERKGVSDGSSSRVVAEGDSPTT